MDWHVADYLGKRYFYSKPRDKEAVDTRTRNRLVALFPLQFRINYDTPTDKVQNVKFRFSFISFYWVHHD